MPLASIGDGHTLEYAGVGLICVQNDPFGVVLSCFLQAQPRDANACFIDNNVGGGSDPSHCILQ